MSTLAQTRSSTTQNYFIPQYKTNKLQRSIKYQGLKLRNLISKEIKNSSSIKLFKKDYKLFLLSQY